jgi:hypothetical protein
LPSFITALRLHFYLTMILAEEFENKYRTFEKLDFKNQPYTFHGFWSYKLKVEKQSGHLLDSEHFDETVTKLGPILKIWKWHRPYEFDECFEPLKKSLKVIAEDYDKVRKFSLLEFDKISTKELEKIWNELSLCKPQTSCSNTGELVMAITKPLMFLWGQTPAFDSVVREKMPLFFISGFKNCRWEFSLFTTVLKRLQHVLLANNELVASMHKISMVKYGTEETLPYGQFIDLCFWTDSEKSGGCIGIDDEPIEPEVEKSIEEYQLFLELINNLKRKGKISAEEWRDYRDQWNNQKEGRSALFLRLKSFC